MDGSIAAASMPQTAKQRGKVAPKKLAHIVLRTPPERVELILEWYKTVLEAEYMYQVEGLGFLTYDDEHHRIAVLGLPGVKEHVDGHAGLHHVAFTYANLGDLGHTYRRLKGEDILPEFCINHGPTTSMYYRDPDGNQIEMQVDNYATVDEATRFMESPAFEQNPIGVNYDPDELLEKFRAGVPEAELLMRPDGEAAAIPS